MAIGKLKKNEKEKKPTPKTDKDRKHMGVKK